MTNWYLFWPRRWTRNCLKSRYRITSGAF